MSREYYHEHEQRKDRTTVHANGCWSVCCVASQEMPVGSHWTEMKLVTTLQQKQILIIGRTKHYFDIIL